MMLYDLTRPRLIEWIVALGGRPVHAARVWRYLYRELVAEPDAMIDLPAGLRGRLAREAPWDLPTTSRETHSTDGLTRKYLLALADARQVETVLMRFRGRATACLSSQAGCALGCVFCATGQRGFSRNLSAGEIVAQAAHVARKLRALPAEARAAPSESPSRREDGCPSLRNIVLMGMGEPLHNYDAVMTAIDILRDPGGLAIAAKSITLSTVGIVTGIMRLADDARPLSLAVSLHAADQTRRAEMIPAARAWPLAELIEACRYYATKLRRRIFFEWTLIENQNDSDDDAHALATLVSGIPAQINLIPLNPTLGFAGQPGDADATRRFQSVLRSHGLPVTVRQRRGVDIAAGCGQLAGDEAAALG